MAKDLPNAPDPPKSSNSNPLGPHTIKIKIKSGSFFKFQIPESQFNPHSFAKIGICRGVVLKINSQTSFLPNMNA